MPEQILHAAYDPLWPNWFTTEAARIREALGPLVLSIEHVGSTAIPGLIAKPILDIVLVVADSTDETAYVPMLEAAGYRLHHREPDWYDHRMFKSAKTALNLHVFSLGCEETDRMILFRDWLRSNPEDRELYAREKAALALQTWGKVQDYADAKTDVVKQILARANAQSASTRRRSTRHCL